MKLQFLLIFLLYINMFSINHAYAVIDLKQLNCSAPTYPPDLVVYQEKVSRSDIQSAIMNGNWRYAIQLMSSFTKQYLSDPCHGTDIIKAIQYVSGQVSKIFHDNSKSEEQRRSEIEELIDLSMTKNASSAAGNSNASYRYSQEFGLTRLSFDVHERDDMCSFEFGIFTTIPGERGEWIRIYAPYYYQHRLKRSPYIKIYRIQEGSPDKLEVQFEGAYQAHTIKYNLPSYQDFIDNFWKSLGKVVWTARNRFSKDPSNLINRPTIDIPTHMYIGVGKKVGFKIEEVFEGNLAAGEHACKEDYINSTTIWVDQDADGKADIVTADEYQAYTNKINGAAVTPIIIDLLVRE